MSDKAFENFKQPLISKEDLELLMEIRAGSLQEYLKLAESKKGEYEEEEKRLRKGLESWKQRYEELATRHGLLLKQIKKASTAKKSQKKSAKQKITSVKSSEKLYSDENKDLSKIERFNLQLPPPPDGVRVYLNESGGVVSEVHITADKSKGADLIEKLLESYAGDIRTAKREIDMDDSLHEGYPVFPQFDSRAHTCLTGMFEYDYMGTCERGIVHGAHQIAGYDFGRTPAVVFAQVVEGQIQVFFEAQALSSGATQFAPYVSKCFKKFPGYGGAYMVHIGDPAGNAKTQVDDVTAYEIFSEYGIDIEPGVVSYVRRQEAMIWALTDFIDEQTPRLVIDANMCPTLVEGLNGGYCLRTVRVGQPLTYGRETFHEKPVKNFFSHTQDALQMIVAHVYNNKEIYLNERITNSFMNQRTRKSTFSRAIVAGRTNH